LFSEFYDANFENKEANIDNGLHKEELIKYGQTLESQLFKDIDFSSFKSPSIKAGCYVPKKEAIQSSQCLVKPIAPIIKSYRVLDAPNLINDPYINILDYSKGLLAVALSHEVYYMNLASSQNGLIISKDERFNDNYSSVCWSDNSSMIATTSYHGSVDIVQRNESLYKPLFNFHPGLNKLYCSVWLGNLLLLGGDDGIMIGFDSKSGKNAFYSKMHSNYLWSIKPSEYNHMIATGGGDNSAKLWDIRKGAIVSSFSHRSNVKGMTWNQKRPIYLATGGGIEDMEIKIWNVVSMECVNKIDAESPVVGLQWSLLSDDLISMHNTTENNIKIWNKKKLIGMLEGHHGNVLTGCLSESGEQLFTIGGEGTLRIWNVYEKQKSKLDDHEKLKMLIR
jgi:cell division cycle 20-like protein 1 (cofactor of APC complex)